MDFRRVLVLGLATAGAMLFGSASCTNVDPQEVTFEGAAEFAIGTTVYQQAAGTAALTTHAEVRIVDSKGALVLSAYSDELGNVWTDPVTGGIPAGSHVGIRNGTTMLLMSTTLGGPADGDCTKSACHGTGGAAGGKVFLQ
jgi:hypothetical protein